VSQTDCRGKVITADALHTRPRFCRQIRRQGGHYVLLVKRNRPELESEIRHLFALPPNPQYPVQSHRTVDVSHGRSTVRRLCTSSELNLALGPEWRDIAQVFLIERWVVRNGIPTFESVCGLTSLPAHMAGVRDPGGRGSFDRHESVSRQTRNRGARRPRRRAPLIVSQ
jgi:predicted transposase YbfD/YdcC